MLFKIEIFGYLLSVTPDDITFIKIINHEPVDTNRRRHKRKKKIYTRYSKLYKQQKKILRNNLYNQETKLSNLFTSMEVDKTEPTNILPINVYKDLCNLEF